jgi:hypothetical protein
MPSAVSVVAGVPHDAVVVWSRKRMIVPVSQLGGVVTLQLHVHVASPAIGAEMTSVEPHPSGQSPVGKVTG